MEKIIHTNLIIVYCLLFFITGCTNGIEGRRTNPIPTNGLVVYYNFEDITNRQVQDLSGNGNDAEIVGDFDTIEIAGQNALALTGSGYGILENPSNLPSGNSPRTLTYWAQLNVVSPAQIFGGYGNTQNCENFQGGTDINTGENLNFFGWSDCNFESNIQITDLVDDHLHHFAYVYNGSSIAMYVDGVVVATTRQELSTTPATLCVGGEVSGSSCVRLLNGNIDEFRIYNRSLSVGEIETFMNN